MDNNYYLTIRQISLMQHALGLDDGVHGRRGLFVTYRNYFDAGESIKAWEDLTEKGLAGRHIRSNGDIEYWVTPEGIAALERIMLIKIKWDQGGKVCTKKQPNALFTVEKAFYTN